LCQKDSFLCAARGIEIEVAFTKKLGAGLFGGEGFILQKLEGNGLAFIHAGGTLLEKDLKSGEVLMVDTGCLCALDPGVDYGKVYLQSLPLSRLADRIIEAGRMSYMQAGGQQKN
jgi:uncharacterized protein (AIM24 family)